MVTYLGSLVQSCCGGEGRSTANKCHWCVWGVCAVSQPCWVCPRSRRVCFPGLHCLGFRLLCWELSEAGPGLCARPSSKLLRFRFSSTPQRCRLSWACVLCPSQARAAQATRNLASAHAAGAVRLITSLVQAARFPRVHRNSTVLGVPCVSSGELTFACNPPGRCQPSRIPGRLG